MRLLKLPNARFHRVAYADPQSILTTDIQPAKWVTRLWSLAHGSEPTELSQPQASVAQLLFRPGGAGFLRAQGVWPDGEPLPLVERAPRIQDQLMVEDRPGWQPFAFAPDGASILFRHAGHINNAYRTHFHLKAPDGTVHDLYQAWGMFTASAAFSPNGRFAAMSSGTRTVAVWDVVARRELRQTDQDDKVNALAFVSDDRLAVAAGRSVRLWNVTNGRSITKFRAFRKFADALAVSHDLKLFAAGSRDGMVRVWDAGSGREVKGYEWGVGEVRQLAFSPDGTTAAAAGTSGVAVWDLD